MPVTYTGRHVTRPGLEHPSLTDIAIGISRQPRFAGQTRLWHSVLDHTLAGDELIQIMLGDVPMRAPGGRLWRLAWLLHDAHEAVTADIPTDYKGPEIRIAQRHLDNLIANAFFPGGWTAFDAWEQEIKEIDRRMLTAEAYLVGPPMRTEDAARFFGEPDQGALDALSYYLGYPFAGVPPYSGRDGVSPLSHPGVSEYLRRVQELL